MPSPQASSVTHSFGGAHHEQPLRAALLYPSRQLVSELHVLQVPCVHQVPLSQSASDVQGLPNPNRIVDGPPCPPGVPNDAD